MVVVRVDDLQKVVDFLLVLDHVHTGNEISELFLIDDAVVITVNALKHYNKLLQELLMFLQLEVQDNLLEVVERQSLVVSLLLPDQLLLTGQLL